jgi:hypothetical protein
MSKVKVYATKASALNLKHPVGLVQLVLGGSMWEQDGFTFRRLQDGAVTRDPAQEYKPPAPAAAQVPAAPTAAAQPAAAPANK